MTDWPRLLDFAELHYGAPLALATLVGREGSSYRQPGARMLITQQGLYAGTLSGGCLEDEIARAALSVLSGACAVLNTIDTRRHYGCPGQLKIFIERLPSAFFSNLAACIRTRMPCRLRTRYSSPGGTLGTVMESSHGSSYEAGEDEAWFDEEVGRQPRLLIVGGSNDAEPLRQMGELLGWQVKQILPAGDPARRETSGHEIVCPPEELPIRFPADDRTAVLVMTHNLARDTHYLSHILPAPYGYIGLLGSRRRRETILGELGDTGLLADETVSDRLFAPMGLDLGAQDPAAIALSIVAEIQAVWSHRSAEPLKLRRAPIHDATPRTSLA